MESPLRCCLVLLMLVVAVELISSVFHVVLETSKFHKIFVLITPNQRYLYWKISCFENILYDSDNKFLLVSKIVIFSFCTSKHVIFFKSPYVFGWWESLVGGYVIQVHIKGVTMALHTRVCRWSLKSHSEHGKCFRWTSGRRETNLA